MDLPEAWDGLGGHDPAFALQYGDAGGGEAFLLCPFLDGGDGVGEEGEEKGGGGREEEKSARREGLERREKKCGESVDGEGHFPLLCSVVETSLIKWCQ